MYYYRFSYFFVEENLFIYAGERINPFEADHSAAVIKLSATYGLLKGFILLISRFRLSQWTQTALAIIATGFIIFISYPVLIHMLFPDLTVTAKGPLFIIITTLLFIFGRRRKVEEDTYVTTSPLLNVLFRLPKRKKGKNPVKNKKQSLRI